MTETVDIVGTVFSEMNLTISINLIADNLDGTYTITTCNTKHLQEGFPITIDGNSYTIKEVVNNTSIKVSGSVLPTVTEFEAYSPYYFHGTVIKVKDDMKSPQGSENVFSRTPFVYLKEILKDTNFRKRSGSPLNRTTDLQMFFLTQSKFKDWKTTDHYEKSIAPMRNLVEMFIDALEKNVIIGDFAKTPDVTTPHVNFGVYVDSKGHEKSIFVDQLSGIELEITLPIKNEKNCNC